MIQYEYFEDLKVDNITIGNGVIEQAKKNKPNAIHTIGCEYASMSKREKAIKWLGVSAAMGHRESQLELGHLFAKSGDYKCALEWYSRPRNEPAAFFYIAKIKFEQERYSEAKANYERAANLHHADAQFQLGLSYYNFWGLDKKKIDKSTGHPVSSCLYKNTSLARQWFYSSAEGGNSLAAYYMGRIYENGEGIAVNKYQAIGWYKRSKAKGYLPANECVERLHKQGYVHVPKDEVTHNEMKVSDMIISGIAFVFCLIGLFKMLMFICLTVYDIFCAIIAYLYDLIINQITLKIIA